jgi:hypothetical protein
MRMGWFFMPNSFHERSCMSCRLNDAISVFWYHKDSRWREDLLNGMRRIRTDGAKRTAFLLIVGSLLVVQDLFSIRMSSCLLILGSLCTCWFFADREL